MARLKLVATPLGNLGDISQRAIAALTSADAIFAEDTRHSLKLIKALNLKLKEHCRLISCDAYKEEKRIGMVVEKLRAKESIVMLSDAGCPTISDPGSLLVQGVIDAGFDVEIIPGPSAHSAALMGAGLDTTRFAFLGFLPQKLAARKRLILEASAVGLALVIYESPLRVAKLLAELYELLGARRVVVARELTKAFETFHRGMLGAPINPPMIEKGECVVVVEAGSVNKVQQQHRPDLNDFIVQELAIGQRSAKDVAKMVAEVFQLKKKTAYDEVIRLSKSLQPD